MVAVATRSSRLCLCCVCLASSYASRVWVFVIVIYYVTMFCIQSSVVAYCFSCTGFCSHQLYICMLCSCGPSCHYEYFEFHLYGVCVCVWRFPVVFVFARVCFVPSMRLLKLCSLVVSCVCLLVSLIVCSFARLLVRLLLCMHLCLFVVCCCRFVFALCCRVRLLFVLVVALFASSLSLMGPGHPMDL